MTRNSSLPTPTAWRSLLAGYAWTRQNAGQSGATVFRLEKPGARALYAKCQPTSAFDDLSAEMARLRWLTDQAIPCPEPVSEVEENRTHWLLTSALPGRSLRKASDLSPLRTVQLAADALRLLHGVEIDHCPFDSRLEIRLNDARARIDRGVVDEDDFDPNRLGRRASDLFDELIRSRPPGEDLVVTHGDATFDNLVASAGSFAGFVDCGKLGVADRHQDLALVIRDIQEAFGQQLVAEFVRRYGREADWKRIEFFQLLDELF